MAVRQVIPSDDPLTLDEVRAHLRINGDDDAYLPALIKVARDLAEAHTNRALLTQTLEYRADRFDCEIILPKPKLQTVLSVKYIATDGTLTTVDTDDYVVDTKSEPGRIYPAYGTTWPCTRDVPDAVTIKYIAGYGARTWTASTAYQVGEIVKSTAEQSNGTYFEVTAILGTGTSGATEPTWSTTADATTVDNTGVNQITWTTRTGLIELPDAIKSWMLIRVADLFEQRESLSTEQIYKAPYSHIDGLLDPYRIYSFP